jgi:hypothetical protein
MMHRVTIDTLSVQREKYQWSEKIEKGFFRGRDSSRERLKLIDVARKYPHLFNCSITNFFFYTDEISKYGPKTPHISLFEFFKHKYQINMDGTVAAYRLPYLLAGNSVVLKQNSQYYEHFYRNLKPYEHFIPFDRNPNVDLVEKIQWLKSHDKEAQKMVKNARQFVRDNLAPKNIFCYYLVALKEFSEKIVSPIVIDGDMERVEDRSNSITCSCNVKF